MVESFEPDFSQSNADMDELGRLSKLHGFNLFEYLRLLSEAGAPTLCCEINEEPAIAAGCRIVRYKLSEGLQVVLAALRARNLDPDEVSSADEQTTRSDLDERAADALFDAIKELRDASPFSDLELQFLAGSVLRG